MAPILHTTSPVPQASLWVVSSKVSRAITGRVIVNTLRRMLVDLLGSAPVLMCNSCWRWGSSRLPSNMPLLQCSATPKMLHSSHWCSACHCKDHMNGWWLPCILLYLLPMAPTKSFVCASKAWDFVLQRAAIFWDAGGRINKMDCDVRQQVWHLNMLIEQRHSIKMQQGPFGGNFLMQRSGTSK